MAIQKPIITPTFLYGPITSYKFEGDISKDKGKYRIRFTLFFKSGDSYSTQQSGYKTEIEARKAKEVLISQLVTNEYIPFHYTVKEVFDYWLYYYLIDEKKISYNTFTSYYNVLYKHVLPQIKEKTKLNQLEISNIIKIVKNIEYPSVQEQCVKILNQLFKFALAKHYIAFNPCIAATENLKKVLHSGSPKRMVIPYTTGEIKKLLYMCKVNFPDMYVPLLISLVAGTRISETIGIMYSDIDFTFGTIYVGRQLGKDMDIDTSENVLSQKVRPKTHNALRGIPVPQWVLDELLVKKAWYERQKQLVPDFTDLGYICCHCDGKPFHRKSFHDDFHTLTAMCGLPKVRWHDLRHMYATVLKNNAVNMKAVSEFLGHASPDFTEDVYVYQKETVHDCSILTEVWENIRPEAAKVKNEVLTIPFSRNEYI